MPEASFTLRVVVGQEGGSRSGIWRIWSNTSSVYLSARNLASTFKISLHDGGKCIAAFTSEFAQAAGGEQHFPGSSRRRDTWVRMPHVGVDQVEIPCRILFPTSELTPRSVEKVRGLVWIPPAASGGAISIGVAFSSHPVREEEWPGRTGGSTLLAAAALPNGESVWIISKQHQLEPQVVAEILAAKAAISSELVGLQADADLSDPRMVICADEQSGRRVYVDAALE